MKEIGTDEVVEGLFELLQQHPEIRRHDVDLREAEEEAAVALLLASTRGDWKGWDTASPATAATAQGLFLDFFGKVMRPRVGEMLGRRWTVPRGTPAEMALSVVAQEVERSHPRQARPH